MLRPSFFNNQIIKYLNFRKDQFIHRRKKCNQLAILAVIAANTRDSGCQEVHRKWKITGSLTGDMEFTGLSIFTYSLLAII